MMQNILLIFLPLSQDISSPTLNSGFQSSAFHTQYNSLLSKSAIMPTPVKLVINGFFKFLIMVCKIICMQYIKKYVKYKRKYLELKKYLLNKKVN